MHTPICGLALVRYEHVTAPRMAFAVEDVNWIAGHPPQAIADLLHDHPGDDNNNGRSRTLTGVQHGDSGRRIGSDGGAQALSSSSSSSVRLTVQVRHGPDTHLASVAPLATPGTRATSGPGSPLPRQLLVSLDDADKGLAPGQYAAFYDGDTCLGAGVIADRSPEELRACIDQGMDQGLASQQ